MKIIDYDVSRFYFRGLIEDVLNIKHLADAHVHANPAKLTRQTDQSTHLHSLFYAGVQLLLPLYRLFVAEVVGRLLPGDGAVIYQKIPTFRVHLPDNVAVGEFHRDRDYNHQAAEVTFWMPFTDAAGTASVWVESTPDRGDFSPAAVKYGQVLVFDAANCRHGNHENKTGRTRVSMDFRAMREEHYDQQHQGQSINTHTPFAVGAYFERMETK